jgi:hypothetical protein
MLRENELSLFSTSKLSNLLKLFLDFFKKRIWKQRLRRPKKLSYIYATVPEQLITAVAGNPPAVV